MSFFKKDLPVDLKARLARALMVGPMNQIGVRIANEIRDYAAQKVSILYFRVESQNWTANQCLDYICDAFGLERPDERQKLESPKLQIETKKEE